MKKIYYIAQNEVRNLFYSPIAWAMMILFLILMSTYYIAGSYDLVRYFNMGGGALRLIGNLTNTTITNPKLGYFFKILGDLYIFFPLITMGLVSREINSGTIKLLYSSPVRIREIILGKYLAMVVFTLALIVMVLFTLISLSIYLSNPDYGQMIASVIGLFFVLCTYAAIGLFISTLTSYQIVAAIATFAVFAFLSNIGGIGQDIDIVRNITYYIDINGKSENLIRGLFSISDVFYFIVIIGTFLAISIIKIKSAAESISGFKKALRYFAVVVVALIVGYITSIPKLNAYADFTRDNIYTISSPTQALVKQLDKGPMEITVFANLLASRFSSFLPENQIDLNNRLWERYIRFKHDIKINYVYYYAKASSDSDEDLKKQAEARAKIAEMDLDKILSPKEVNKLFDVKKEEYRHFFKFDYNGKTSIVRTFNDPRFFPDENNIAAAINLLIATPPKIYFLTGHIERNPFSPQIRDYNELTRELSKRYSLVNQGYAFDTLSLKSKEVPKDITGLVIADPRVPISSEELEKIYRYVNQGGNLLVATEPDRRDILKPLLDTLGVKVKDGLLISSRGDNVADMIYPHMSETAKSLHPVLEQYLKEELRYYGDSSVFNIVMRGANAIEYNEKGDFKVNALLTTNSDFVWNRIAPISQDSLLTKVNRMPSDEKGSFTTAFLMERNIEGKNQKVTVFGDADYLTESLMDASGPRNYNFRFGFWCFSIFTDGEFPANTMRYDSDNSFDVEVADTLAHKIALYYIIPGIIAIIGMVVLIRRQRK